MFDPEVIPIRRVVLQHHKHDDSSNDFYTLDVDFGTAAPIKIESALRDEVFTLFHTLANTRNSDGSYVDAFQKTDCDLCLLSYSETCCSCAGLGHFVDRYYS